MKPRIVNTLGFTGNTPKTFQESKTLRDICLEREFLSRYRIYFIH